ncbi:unnamed protein product [Arctia plantaginis]|uniref:Uncharacterized protein n=1 Tax=Arctia plantaginis TaxID=874455 RepID=A0A8S1A339_ARCPL|nr:unnamed protein product [Arctia plantaginis]
MPHRQSIFSKGFVSRRPIQVEDQEYGNETAPRRARGQFRPMLSSSKDLTQMAIESSKARLVQPLISQFGDFNNCRSESNEFGSSYRATSRYGPFSITSHTNRLFNSKTVKQDVKRLPSFVSQVQNCVRLDVTTSQSSPTETGNKSTFTCKCKTCTNPRCPSKIYNKKQIVFDGNVQTFCDGITMTSKLVDAECDGGPLCSKTDCGVNTTILTTIETDESTQVQEPIYCRPITVTEKSTSSLQFEYAYRRAKPKFYDETVPKVNTGCQCVTSDVEREEPKQSLQCFFRRNEPMSIESNYKETISGVKNLYNEGISEDFVDQGTDSCTVAKIKMPRCKESKCCSSRPHIPFSHRHYSKYHHNCKHPKEFQYGNEEDDMPVRHCADLCPRYMRKPCGRHCPPIRTMPSIRLPKRVLTSDRNIDDFVNKSRCYPKCKNTFGVQAVLLM